MGNRIKDIRERRDLTQQQLADMVGTTKQQIGRLEAAKRRLSDQWVRKLAAALEVHPGELLEEMPAPDLNERERALLETFRGLSEDQQDAFMKVFNSLAKSPSAADGRKKAGNGS